MVAHPTFCDNPEKETLVLDYPHHELCHGAALPAHHACFVRKALCCQSGVDTTAPGQIPDPAVQMSVASPSQLLTFTLLRTTFLGGRKQPCWEVRNPFYPREVSGWWGQSWTEDYRDLYLVFALGLAVLLPSPVRL